jgi:hypothetical protein
MKRSFSILASSLLAACGADVASTAQTTATLQAAQASQAKAQQEQLKQAIDAAARRTEAAASAAGEN